MNQSRPLQSIRDSFEAIEFDNELLEQAAARPLRGETWREVKYLLSTLPAAFVALLIWSVGGPLALPLAITIIGIPFTILMFWFFRKYAGVERRRALIVADEPIIVRYDEPEGNVFERGLGYLSDIQTWKDLGWMFVLSTFGLALALFALGVWLIAISWIIYPLWGWSVPADWTPLGPVIGPDLSFIESFLIVPFGIAMIVVATWLGAAITYGLVSVSRACLGSSEERKLRGRVSELERTREETLSQQSTEMSRIERDLHDGAQARLVALAMDLGMAEQKLDDDPTAARELVTQARDEAQRTLQELRDLVRGIGPQILRDRGLEAALVPLAARSPIEVDLNVNLPERPGERYESTAYFVVSEALANAIKHSQAKQININLWNHEQWLYVRVSDNGVGGANPEGSGLRGLRARAESVDGRLMIESPTGGPTIIDAWLPMS
jgi:signal transduction histidine kinase